MICSVILLCACAVSTHEPSEKSFDSDSGMTEKNMKDSLSLGATEQNNSADVLLHTQIDNMAVYREIFEAYRNVIVFKNDWYSDFSMGDPLFYQMDYYAEPGYCFADLNNDGMTELLIGCTDQSVWSGIIYDLYTYYDGEVVKVLESKNWNWYRLLKDGLLANEVSNAANSFEVDYYSFDSKNITLSSVTDITPAEPQTIIYSSFSQLPSFFSSGSEESFPTSYAFTGSGGSMEHLVAANPMLFWEGDDSFRLIPYLRECGLGEFGYVHEDTDDSICKAVVINMGNLEVGIYGSNSHYIRIETPNQQVYIETGERGNLINVTSTLYVSHDTLDALFKIMPFLVTYEHTGCPLAGTGVKHHSFSGDLRIDHTDHLDAMVFNSMNTVATSNQTGDPYNPSAVDPSPFWEGDNFFDIQEYLKACGGWNVNRLLFDEEYAGVCCDFGTTSLSIYGNGGAHTIVTTKVMEVYHMDDVIEDDTPIRVDPDHEVYIKKGQLDILFRAMPNIVLSDSEGCPFAGLDIKHYCMWGGSYYHDD